MWDSPKSPDDRLHAAWRCSPAGFRPDPGMGVQTELHNLVLGDYIRAPITSLILFEGIQVDIGAQWDGYASLAADLRACFVKLVQAPCALGAAACKQRTSVLTIHRPAPARGMASASQIAAQLQPKGQTQAGLGLKARRIMHAAHAAADGLLTRQGLLQRWRMQPLSLGQAASQSPYSCQQALP